MATFSIIGTGAMANAIGGLLAAGGSAVSYVTRDEVGAVEAAPLGDVVVLAVPHTAVDGILDAYGPQLSGKVLVDVTNPLDFETFDSLVVPAGSSEAALVQAKVPGARVLKAFNTTFAGTLAARKVGDTPTTVLVAGDDAAAKATLIAAVEAGGLPAVDAGSLARAHELESIGFLQVTLAASGAITWTGGFALVR